MSGRTAVQCLPCGKKIVVKEMSSHIHEHVHYYPQKCNDCDFRCVNKSDLDFHTYESDHTGSVCFDPYKQWLVDTINDDCRFAAKFGVDELLKRKNITFVTPAQQQQTPAVRPPPPRFVESSSDDEPQQVAARPIAPAVPAKRNSEVQNRNNPRTPTTQPSPVVTQQQQTPTPVFTQQKQTPGERTPPPRFCESSSDSDDESQKVAGRPKVPAVPVKRNSGVQNRRPDPPAKDKSESDNSEDSDDEEIVKLRQELTKNVKCSLCKKTVCISISARQSHVKENHMDGLTNGSQSAARKIFQSELEKRTKDAFPGLVWTCLQCPKCPKMKELKSDSGRISHVYNTHHTYLRRLGCPKTPCIFTSFDPHEFKKHFIESHGSPSNWKLFLGNSRPEREFPANFAEYRRKIEAISRLLFPLDIPQPERSVKKRKSRGDDDGDEVLDISALLAAAPSKPTGPSVAPKRRRSPVSSDEDSDEDKPSGRKKSAAAASKPRASVKQEEGTEREEDQDSTRSSSGATVAGHSIGSKKGEAEVKKEVEIKQEPPSPPSTGTPFSTGGGRGGHPPPFSTGGGRGGHPPPFSTGGGRGGHPPPFSTGGGRGGYTGDGRGGSSNRGRYFEARGGGQVNRGSVGRGRAGEQLIL